MGKAPKRIRVAPDSDLVHAIQAAIADGVHVVVDTGVDSYPVHLDPVQNAAAPKSKRMKARIRSLAGVWSDLDAEGMIEKLYKSRHEAPPSDPLTV